MASSSSAMTLPQARRLENFAAMTPDDRREQLKCQRWKRSPHYVIHKLSNDYYNPNTQCNLWLYFLANEQLMLKEAQKGLQWLHQRAIALEPWELDYARKVQSAVAHQWKQLYALPPLKTVMRTSRANHSYFVGESTYAQRNLPLLTIVKTLKSRVKSRTQEAKAYADLKEVTSDWKKLGSGAYSEVYHGKLKSRAVAIKARNHKEGTGHIRYEIDLLHRLQGHRNIIPLLACGKAVLKRESCAREVMVMELGKEDLHCWLKRWRHMGYKQRYDHSTMLSLAIQLAAATEHCHRKGVIHGDITLSNFVISRHGTVRLVDLGLSFEKDIVGKKDIDERVQALFRHRGTLHYCPYERRVGRGIQSQAGDIYRLGVCLYKIASGKLLADNVESLNTDSEETYLDIMDRYMPPPAEDCAQPFRPLVARCLAPDASTRPQAKELLQELFDLALS